MFKLGLEKAEEPEIKLPTSVGSSKKQESSRKKKSTFDLLTAPELLTVWITTNCGKFLFYLYAEYIMRNTGLNEAQAGIKAARRNINNPRYAEDTNLMAENQRGTEEPLDEGERGE